MTDEAIQSVPKGYDASSIRVLGGIEHVRLRPAMYIGDTSERGLHHLLEEIVANSVDEAMAGNCDEIRVTLYADGSVSVSDNGRGIPVGPHPETGTSALEVVMTTLNAGGKFDNNSYKVSGGLHGVGASCVNALSEWMEVEVCTDGHMHYQRYEYGEPKTPVEQRGKTSRTGTKSTFKPDTGIFQASELQYDTIAGRLRELAFLNSGTRINLLRESDGREDAFYYENGIREFVAYLNNGKTTLHEDVISISAEVDDLMCEIALQYNDGYSEILLSFANNINTVDGGTHLSGLRSALTRTFNNYARDRNLVKDINPSGDDYREGLTAVISVKLGSPQFEGQTKTRLGNRNVQGLVEQICGEQLRTYCEENPKAAQGIIDKAVDAARAREAARKARDLTRRKGALSGGGMPGALRDCSRRSSDGTEMFIVEGQSAGGTASMGRDREFQAILPLRGVILNVEKARVDKMLNNEQILNLITALGTGIGTGLGTDDFTLEKLRYGKIIIMTDADIDGAHIRTLLLTFFFRQMPELIEKGHLYVAQPPLYKITRKRRIQYVADDRALQEVLIDLGAGDARLDYDLNGDGRSGTLETEQFRRLIDLLAALDGLARLVEQHGMSHRQYLALRDAEGRFPLYRVSWTDSDARAEEKFFFSEEEFDRFVLSLQEELQKHGDEVEIVDEDDYEGLVRTKGAPNVVKPRRFQEASRIGEVVAGIEAMGIPADYLASSAEGTFVIRTDGDPLTVSTLAGIVPALRELGRRGLEIERYKGLGEMNATELADTTLKPGSRSLVQVTVGDAIRADSCFTILAGKDVKRRREFIEMHALEVRDLDV